MKTWRERERVKERGRDRGGEMERERGGEVERERVRDRNWSLRKRGLERDKDWRREDDREWRRDWGMERGLGRDRERVMLILW